MNNITYLWLSLFLSFAVAVAEPSHLPESDGNFFYADLRQGKVYGMHFIDVLVGSNKQHFQLSLNSK